MIWSKKDIAFDLARRKIQFHYNEDWKSIKTFGLFNWGDISCYLVGNPSNLKGFKEGILTTNMNKNNHYIWASPTEDFYNEYVKPIIDKLKDKPYKDQLKYFGV